MEWGSCPGKCLLDMAMEVLKMTSVQWDFFEVRGDQ